MMFVFNIRKLEPRDVLGQIVWAVSLAGLFMVIGAAVVGCASSPTQEAAGPIFYPEQPDPPRIQYLATFSHARDLSGGKSGFASFLLGQEGEEDLAIIKPYGIAVDGNKFLVVDSSRQNYVVFDTEKREVRQISGSGSGTLVKPINITVDRQDGTRYVTDTRRGQVLLFDREDRYLRAYGERDQFTPSDVAVQDQVLYVSDVKGQQIHILNKNTGKLVGKLGAPGSKEGQLFHPTNLTIGPDGHLYIVETNNFRVQKWTLDGKFVRSFGSIGLGIGHFARPKGVAVDRSGNIFVVDAMFNNVQVFDQEGRLLLFFGSPGEMRGNLNLPAGIAIDYESVGYFQRYAVPKFKLEYVIFVTSQFGPNKVNVYGFGKMEGVDYAAVEAEKKK